MSLLRQTIAVAGVLGVAVVGCAESESVAPTCTVTGQTGPLVLNQGEVGQPAAAAACIGVATPRLTWSSDAPAIATVDSETGRVVAVAPGLATLSARVPGVSPSFDIRVLVAACRPGAAIAFETPRLALPVAGRVVPRVFVIADPRCPAPTTVVYSIDDASIARVDSSGAVNGVSRGQTTLRAQIRENPSIETRIPVSVTSSGSFDPVISPISLSISVGDTARITANAAQPADPPGTDDSFLFRSLNPAIATVSATGLVTGRSPGDVIIALTAVRDSNLRFSVGVTVRPPRVSLHSTP